MEKAGAIVINADFARAMKRLIPDRLRRRWTDRKIAGKKFSCSTFMMYLGVEGEFSLPHHNIHISGEYERNLDEIENQHVLSDDPSFYVQNASVTDTSLAPRGMSALYVLAPVTHQHANVDWSREKERFRAKMLRQIEKAGFTDVERRIRFERIVTPDDWDAKYEVHQGATFNLAHTLRQMLHLRPHNRFEDVDGIYLVGGGTHPGSGLPVIFESARISSRLLLADLGVSPMLDREATANFAPSIWSPRDESRACQFRLGRALSEAFRHSASEADQPIRALAMNAVLESPSSALTSSRATGSRESVAPMSERLRVVRRLRRLIAENATDLAATTAAVWRRPVAEKLVSEVLPLADACRWLERNAAQILAPRRLGRRGRPFWLQGVSVEVQRQPFGKVLVIGPANYPLFLPAVQTLQALVAGNRVLLKPAPGTREVARHFAKFLSSAGLDPALLTVLPDTAEAAREAIVAGVDKVVFTGSSENGREVLALLAATNTPSVMELSGDDAVIVLADADLDLVARALRFGARLNDGETCIAPRRLIVVETVADPLLALISEDLDPRLQIERVPDETSAIALANAADFALGASIFSRDIPRARSLAAQIRTGFVVINDLIVPTADPRVPFGGARASGFGSTRGPEGLLEMTFPHVVTVRRGRSHPHFDPPGEHDARLFAAYIRAAHGRRRLGALREFFAALIAKVRGSNS